MFILFLKPQMVSFGKTREKQICQQMRVAVRGILFVVLDCLSFLVLLVQHFEWVIMALWCNIQTKYTFFPFILLKPDTLDPVSSTDVKKT